MDALRIGIGAHATPRDECLSQAAVIGSSDGIGDRASGSMFEK
jgi:hypothetical protein